MILHTRPTEKDIQRSNPSGAYFLGCGGRHDSLYHVYYFFTKKEVVRRWREEHPLKDR